MRRGFWLGLVQIVFLYSALYLFFYEAPYKLDIPYEFRQLIYFGSLLGVYGLGTYHLRLVQHAWMGALWHLIHLIGISVLILFGLYDWVIQPVPNSIRIFMRQIHEFLVAPTLYVGMGLLSRFLKGANKTELLPMDKNDAGR